MRRMKKLILASFAVMVPFSAAAESGPSRLALVISNSDYDLNGQITTSSAVSTAQGYLIDLPNPRNDGAAMRRALLDLGFEVTVLTNANRESLTTALALFGARIAGAPSDAVVVIYYSGHAIQVNGANFLLPSAARIPRNQDLAVLPPQQAETMIRAYSVPLNDIFAQLRSPSAGGLNLVIMDSCRDNPWESRINGRFRSVASRGLAEQVPRLRRTLVAYSTSPGDVASDGEAGANSPYTRALLQWIRRPGFTVLQMLNNVGRDVVGATGQIPWMNNAPVEDICLAGCGRSQVGNANSRPGASVGDANLMQLNSARAALASFSPIEWTTLSWAVRRDRLSSAASISTYRALAESGNARAMFFVGSIYGQRGPDRAPNEALRWIRRAAEANEPFAQGTLAYLYQEGDGVPQDLGQALSWYRRAANQGERYSQTMVGTFYAEGRGVPQDYREAAFWYRLATEQGMPAAQYNLGRILVMGLGGVPQSRDEGLSLIRRAADAGLQQARDWLANQGRDVQPPPPRP